MRKPFVVGRSCASLAAAVLLFNGCTLLAPQPDRSRFFTLVSAADLAAVGAPPPEGSTTDGLAGRAIGIGPVKLPGYLDRREIATRVSPNRIQYAPLDLWAEPLFQNMTRVLQADLASRLGGARLLAWPWLGPVDYQVAIDVGRFEAAPEGASLDARWTIRSGVTGDVIASGRTSVVRRIEGKGAAADVAALSAALSDLAEQLIPALERAAVPAANGSSRNGTD